MCCWGPQLGGEPARCCSLWRVQGRSTLGRAVSRPGGENKPEEASTSLGAWALQVPPASGELHGGAGSVGGRGPGGRWPRSPAHPPTRAGRRGVFSTTASSRPAPAAPTRRPPSPRPRPSLGKASPVCPSVAETRLPVGLEETKGLRVLVPLEHARMGASPGGPTGTCFAQKAPATHWRCRRLRGASE